MLRCPECGLDASVAITHVMVRHDPHHMTGIAYITVCTVCPWQQWYEVEAMARVDSPARREAA